MFDLLQDAIGCACGVTIFQAFVGEAAEAFCGGFAFGNLGGVFVAQFVEREGEAGGEAGGGIDGGLMIAEEAAHFTVGAEAQFGIGEGGDAEALHRFAKAHGREHIRDFAPRAVMHEGAGGGERGEAKLLSQPDLRHLAELILAVVFGDEEEVHLVGELAGEAFGVGQPVGFRQGGPRRAGAGDDTVERIERRVQEKLQAAGKAKQFRKMQAAITLCGMSFSFGQKAAEIGPALAVFGQSGERDAFLEDQSGGGNEAGAHHLPARRKTGGRGGANLGQAQALGGFAGNFAGGGVGAHDSCNGIDIGNRHGGQAKAGGLVHHLFGVRGPGEEGEIAESGKLGEGRFGHEGSIFLFCSFSSPPSGLRAGSAGSTSEGMMEERAWARICRN